MAMDAYQASPTAGPRCSELTRALDEPLAGTSSVAAGWLCIEQAGPWGREALTESHIDPAVGAELAARVHGTGIRIALIRRAGSHPDRHRPTPHRVYLAHTAPGRSWLERADVADPKELLDLDFTAFAAGRPSGLGTLVETPVLLVCTNGRRDVCCALLGRPVAAALATRHGEAVWECNHIGGHRFSPTAIVLPSGYSYGRLDVESADRLLTAGAEVNLAHCRGRSSWSTAGQIAELAVRARIGDLDPDTLRVAGTDPAGSVEVTHVDGRRWLVTVVEHTAPALRSASCGAAPTPSVSLRAAAVRELVTD